MVLSGAKVRFNGTPYVFMKYSVKNAANVYVWLVQHCTLPSHRGVQRVPREYLVADITTAPHSGSLKMCLKDIIIIGRCMYVASLPTIS